MRSSSVMLYSRFALLKSLVMLFYKSIYTFSFWTYLLYARSNDVGYRFKPALYMSIARLKNRVAFAASPARHLPAACSCSSAASRKSFSDCGSWALAFDFGFGLRKVFGLGGMLMAG
jgi:hypothetical protein